MTNSFTNSLALLLLTLMAFFSILSMRQDALTFDELAHIPAGYSYLTQQDYRINPEHPPLAKDLAALPLLFLDLNFPSQSQNWQQNSGAPPWWVQFDLGTELLYQSGNDPQNIIFWSRLPMIGLLLFLGWFLFRWARELGGNKAGLLVLFLFTLSPTLLAHGRLVTTDVAAATGIVVATYYWLHFLREPTKNTVLKAGLAFGVALLLKFSLVLLVPFFVIITLLYPLISPGFPVSYRIKSLVTYTGKAAIAGIIGLVFVVWPVYQFHIWNYPAERQVRDTTADLQPGEITALEQTAIWMADKEGLRPFGQYARGVLMAQQRSSFGNTTYFLGEMSSSSWWYYFPVMYLTKVPLAFHILSLIAGIFAVSYLTRTFLSSQKLQRAQELLRTHFTSVAFIIFLFIYWGISIQGNLNIGVRHLIPIFPFTYLLVASGILAFLSIRQRLLLGVLPACIVAVLLAWYAGASVLTFPHYISYYNEAAGGTEHGHAIAVDSNYDWGQDFYRLLAVVEDENIETLHMQYFGGENPEYWLGDTYVRYNAKEDGPLGSGWLAVSMNELKGGIAEPAPGYDQDTGYYEWLLEYEPMRIGKSILLYQIE